MKLVRTKKKVEAQPGPGPEGDSEAREAVADRKKVRAGGTTLDSKEENLFRRYLRDVNTLQVMAPEQEFALARQIEALKIELWKVMLGHRGGAALVVDAIKKLMPTPWKGFDAYQRTMLRRSAPENPGAAARSAQERRLQQWSEEASLADPEGIFVEAVVEHLLKLPPTFTRKCRGWDTYRRSLSTQLLRLRDAKNGFVKANLRLVVAVAARYSRELLSFEDLVQEGNIGLMKAVDRYDYRRGFRFSTYASWWIRHAIGRALADKARLVRLPVHVLDSLQKVEKVRRTLAAQMGRRPTAQEISSTAGIPIEEVEKINSLPSMSPVSLDEPFSDQDDDRSRLDALADPEPGPEPVDRMEAVQKEKAILRLMGALKPVEVDILQKRFGLLDGRERTLQEIGDEHSLSRERIRQVQDRALSKLRGAMAQLFPTGDESAFASMAQME